MSTPRQSKPRSRAGRPRGRPPVLDRERIVEAASSIGIAQFTMQAVAKRLGVTDAALYHHFRSREELVRAVVDVMMGEAPFPTGPDRPWRDWLANLAASLRALLRAHPGAAAFAAASGPTSPEQMRLVARTIGVLMGAGFDARQAALVYSLVTNFVVSSVQIEERRTAARRARRDIPTRFARALREHLPGEETQQLHEVAKTWARTSPDEHFDFGLEALLDGLDRLRRRRTTRR